MKKITLRLKKRWHKMKQLPVSITMKWTLLSSFFIFLLFTLFAWMTFSISTQSIVQQERDKVSQTMQKIDEHLRVSKDRLETTTVPELLQANEVKKNGTSTGAYLNDFVTELYQPGLSVVVYSPKGQVLFRTKEVEDNFEAVKTQSVKLEEVAGQTGFVGRTPVYQENTKKLLGYVQTFYQLHSFYEIKQKLLSIMIVLEIVGIGVSFILGYLVSSYLLSPLKQMRTTMNTIREEPQADVRMPELKTRDELADLSESFNEMIDRMQRFITQQQQFVEDVSHELRTPVAIIEGHLKLLNRWGKDDPVVLEESLQASLQEVVRMKSLVQEMLDLSRLEQVEFQQVHEWTRAKEVIHQTYNNFEILYPEFTFILDDDLTKEVELQINRHHLEQLLIILLDNAVKYSMTRKEVHISVSRARSQLEIAIQDFGEGIEKEDLDKIFNRFYRVDKARSRNKGGNGLGLSIAHQLVESYHGSIAAESAPGNGTVFRVFLPIKKTIDDKQVDEGTKK